MSIRIYPGWQKKHLDTTSFYKTEMESMGKKYETSSPGIGCPSGYWAFEQERFVTGRSQWCCRKEGKGYGDADLYDPREYNVILMFCTEELVWERISKKKESLRKVGKKLRCEAETEPESLVATMEVKRKKMMEGWYGNETNNRTESEMGDWGCSGPIEFFPDCSCDVKTFVIDIGPSFLKLTVFACKMSLIRFDSVPIKIRIAKSGLGWVGSVSDWTLGGWEKCCSAY